MVTTKAANAEFEAMRSSLEQERGTIETKMADLEKKDADTRRTKQIQALKLQEMQKENTAMYSQLVAIQTSAANQLNEQQEQWAQERVSLSNQVNPQMCFDFGGILNNDGRLWL